MLPVGARSIYEERWGGGMISNQQQWDIGGWATCVYDSGAMEGRPALVMLHGGDVRSLATARDWETIWDPEDLGCRLIAYDKPGQGFSYDTNLPETLVTSYGLSSHLEGVVEASGASDVVLLGHSRGALPVADLALRRPEMISGLVLVASNTLAPPSDDTPVDFYSRAFADPPPTPDLAYVRREPEMNSYLTDHVDQQFLDHRLRVASHAGWWENRGTREELCEREILPSLRELRNSVIKKASEEGFKLPVCVVWGHEDVSAPATLGRQLYDAIAPRTADCWFFLINRSGHYVYRERPKQFKALLKAFVDTCIPRNP